MANVGNDSILCGNITQPCKTLPHAIKIANWGDAIFLSSPIGETYVTYSCLDDSYGYHINKNLTMRGTPGRAIIDCNGTEMTALFHIKSLKRDHVTLKIDNLEMRNISSPYTVITIEDASLSVRNCIFKDVWSAGTISISGSAKTGSIPHLFIQNSLFASNTNPVMLQDYQAADVEAVNTLFTDEKKFYNCKGIFVNRQSSVPPGFPAPDPPDNLHLRVQNCTFKYNMFGIAVLGLANHTHAEIEGSTFIENKATGLSMILDKGAGLRIDVDTYEKQQVEFLIKNSLFRGNKANVGGGVSIFATPKDYKAADNVLNISFVNVRFEYNMAEQAGGATYIYCLDIQNLITFNNCTFDSNSVISEDPQGRVSHWFVPAETGAGGAVSIDKGNLVIERTSFGNNTATVFGSTICSKANISLKNVGINGSVPRGKSPAIGDLFYSETSAQLINVTFRVVSAVNGIPSVWQKAYDKDDSLYAKNITFICPVGHNVKSVKVKSYTLPKNYYALIYYCLCCPVNTYSLLYGQETLYRRNVSTREVTCFDCPFGAICDPIIKAEPNFYGFANTAEQPSVQLTICPHEYCCSKNCSTINSCRHNREGTLCGRWKKGYSDNLLDTKCTLNSECTDIWIWLVIAALGICYILFFLYVEELVRLIRTIIWPFEFGSSDDCSDEGKSEISEEQQPTVISGEQTEETDGKQQPQQQQKQQQSSSFASSLLKVIFIFIRCNLF